MFVKLCAVLLVTLSAGCSAFFPKHPNSQVKDGERVEISMLTWDDICKSYEKEYTKVFPDKTKEPCPPADRKDKRQITQFVEPLTLSTVAMVAAGMAVDAVSSELQREATEYEGQFKATKAFDGFWIKNNASRGTTKTNEQSIECSSAAYPEKDQNVSHEKQCKNVSVERIVNTETTGYEYQYFGIEIKRTANGIDGPVFKFALGFKPSFDQQMFMMKPIFFQTTKSKAKVLGDSWWTWLPPMILGKLFRDPGHSIDTDINVQVDAYWRGQDQMQHVSTVAASTFTINDYSLDKPEEETQVGGGTGWLVSVPVSHAASGVDAATGDRRGTFTVYALVTEKDHSNAKKYLEQGAQFLRDKKGEIVNKVGQSLGK